MSITSAIIGTNVTLSIEGRFDFSCHKDFRSHYSQYERNDTHFIVDLIKTDYIDSSALGMLLLLREYATTEDYKDIVKIINANDSVYDILKVSNFDKLFIME